MNKIDDGGPAFLVCSAQAIGPLLQQHETYTHENWRLGIAIDAYAMADAMLAARERTPRNDC